MAQNPTRILAPEQELIKKVYEFTQAVQESSQFLSPSKMGHYALDLAKAYNKFYAEVQVLKETDLVARSFRLKLSHMVANTLQKSLGLLGIATADRM